MAGIEIIKKLQHIEQSRPVDTWTYRGMDLWPVLRTNLAFSMDPHSPTYTQRSLWSAGIQALMRLLSHFLYDLRNWRNLIFWKKTDFVFFGSTYESHITVDGKIYNFQSDPIVQIAAAEGFSSGLLDYSFLAYAPRGKRKTPSLSLTFFLLAGGVLGMAAKLLPFSDFAQLRKKLVADLAEFQILPSKTIEKIVDRIPVIYLWSKIFGFLLSVQKTRAVFITSYYGPVGSALCFAARKAGLTVVDVQHGLVGEAHPGYASFTRSPARGWINLPNHFWLWSALDVDGFSTWPESLLKTHRVHNLGDPQALAFLDPSSQVLASSKLKFSGLLESLHKKSPRILITLQLAPQIGEHFMELIRSAPSDWQWLIRVHPSMRSNIKQYEKQLAEFSNVEIRQSSVAPLYLLLTQCCDLHLTENSSTVVQAANLGIRSILVHPTGKEYFAEFVQRSMAFECLDSATAIATIQRLFGELKSQAHLEQSRDRLESVRAFLRRCNNSAQA